MIVISAPVMVESECKVKVSSDIKVTIDGKREVRSMWLEIDSEHKDFLCLDKVDGFVVALLSNAFVLGLDIKVNGSMSSKLFYNIKNSIIPILSIYYDKPRIGISCDFLLEENDFYRKNKAVISGFSAGVDSFSNYYDHSGDGVSKEFRITHFLYNNVGSHGKIDSKKDFGVFSERRKLIRKYSDSLKIPLVSIDTNFHEIILGKFQKSHTLTNSAVALILQGKAAKFLYSSGLSFGGTVVSPRDDIAFLDPVLLPLIKTEHFESILSGAKDTRVKKTFKITKIEKSREYLDVCVNPTWDMSKKINCSACYKCLRTQLTLDIFGVLDEYSSVFLTGRYHKRKNFCVLEVLTSKNPLEVEIKNSIDVANFSVPLKIRVISKFIPSFVVQYIMRLLYRL